MNRSGNRIALVFLGLLCVLSGQTTKEQVVLQKQPVQKLLGRTDRKFSVHNGNKILTRFYNFGGIGDWTIAGRYDSGIYPVGSGRSYIAEFTPVVGASVVLKNGTRRHIISDGMVSNNGKDLSDSGYQWGFEPLTGYANPNQENIAMSDDISSWPDSWVNKPSDWDGAWNGQYGKYARADQESYFVMDDYYNDEFQFFPDSTDTLRRGLGIQVEVRGYQWSHPAAEDIIIWTYWITNVGNGTLDSVCFGMYGDGDIGDDGDQGDDDSWFDQENSIVYQWDHDNWSNAKGGFKPAYFGWTFLESPGNPHDQIDNDFDGMVDESQFDGIDNDEDWDVDNDDIGSDGLGPTHEDYIAPDLDGTEGNGMPDVGEPNFEYTDNDESDQIGLTSFFAAPWPNITASDDEQLWKQLRPGFFDVPEQTKDITFLFGSGYFSLLAGERKKFAVAMLFGEDLDDILRNAETMQKIYDADYSFSKPPGKPILTAVPGDGKVTLYWDKKAESSRDPIYGYDFEGYRIYRSTDPAFLEPWIITDAYGNLTFKKPIAQFDLINGLKGPHPVAFNGIQFNMGKDDGLRHFWEDTTVQNGQTYYYAITAYDKGYDTDFFDRGLTEFEKLQPLAPSECTIIVDLDASGNVLVLGENVAEVVPDAPSAGYIPPNTPDSGHQIVVHDSGSATGSLIINTVDPDSIHDQWEYSVDFQTEGKKTYYSIINQEIFTDTVEFASGWFSLHKKNLIPGSVAVASLDGSTDYDEGIHFEVTYDLGIISCISGALCDGKVYLVSYQYYPLYKSDFTEGEPLNPIIDGMQIMVYNDRLALLEDSSGWVSGDCEYIPKISVYTGGSLYPADFELIWGGSPGDSISRDEMFGIAAPFNIWNISEDRETRFVIMDEDGDKEWDPEETIIILPYETGTDPSFKISFNIDSLQIDTIFINDTTVVYDTTSVQIEDVEKGDILKIQTAKPFSSNDVYSFVTTVSRIDESRVRQEMNRIAVVPNPYIVTASWERQHLYVSGRGTRKIDFIHLPQKCKIKIYTLSGFFVDTINHESAKEDGSESWDMLSKDGLEIAFGIYIYHVDAPGIGEKIGKFAIIK